MTSFALLLGGNNGGGNGCDSSDFDYILSWISFGFVVFAIYIFCISMILIEIRTRSNRQGETKLRIIEHSTSRMSKI